MALPDSMMGRLAVYVDEPIWEWRGRSWCHLVADDGDELHRFAAQLGLRRRWFQAHPGPAVARPCRTFPRSSGISPWRVGPWR